MSLIKRITKGLRYIVTGVPPQYVKAEISYIAPDRRLEGKRILVTGGSRGIGRAMAERFVREGASVVVTGRDRDALETMAKETGAAYIVSDISSMKDLDALFAEADRIAGGIDAVVSNAGISLHEGNIMNVTEEEFDAQFATNLKGAYFLSQKYLAYLSGKGVGKADILFVSSERGEYVDDLPYGLTKNALNCLVRGLAARYSSKGIRVNGVAPGVTASDMTGFSEEGNLYVDYNPGKRVFLPGEVAEVACFLLSDASACLSGQILVCNQGKSLNPHWKV